MAVGKQRLRQVRRLGGSVRESRSASARRRRGSARLALVRCSFGRCGITHGCGRRKGGRFCAVSGAASTLPAHTSRLCAPEPCLLYRTVAGVIGAARFGVGSVIAPWRLARLASPVAVGRLSVSGVGRRVAASAARRSAASFANLGRLISAAWAGQGAACSGPVFVRSVRYNPWLRATQRPSAFALFRLGRLHCCLTRRRVLRARALSVMRLNDG